MIWYSVFQSIFVPNASMIQGQNVTYWSNTPEEEKHLEIWMALQTAIIQNSTL